MFSRQGIDFSPYKEFKLEPIVGIKLHPRADGTIRPGDLKLFQEQFELNWKHSEGGILYNLGGEREFYNCILNYHSPAKTTGSAEWDKLFKQLKDNGFRKSTVPCMFFARESGCLDNDCPFLHDEEMFRERRNAVLELRREALFAPTPKQRMQHMQRIMKEERTALSMLDDLTLNDTHDDDDEDDQTEDEETKVRVPRVKHFCANSDCLKPWFRKDKGQPPLQNCAKCKWTFYCSTKCQKIDWSRHKKECAPADVVITNDELWSPIGTRKGTESLNINWGDS